MTINIKEGYCALAGEGCRGHDSDFMKLISGDYMTLVVAD